PQSLANISVVVQQEPRGNGDAVLQARALVGERPFVMLWGDDIVIGDDSAAAQLLQARERLGGGSVVASTRIGKADTGAYGAIAAVTWPRSSTRRWRVRTSARACGPT